MLPGSGYHEQLFAAACRYLTRGWSVIPVFGDADPARAKIAAVGWSAYQHRRCTATEAHRWFVEQRYSGLAVVTGRVSGLAVLDFDEMTRFEDFQRDHPDLTDTYTVQTRRGVHLYFHLPSGIAVRSRKTAGIDLLAAGRYVVAPPTTLDNCAYEVVKNVEPRRITEREIQRLEGYFSPQNPHVSDHRHSLQIPASTRDFEASGGPSCSPISGSDLQALYRYLATQQSRNEALFYTGLRARDEGWPREDAVGLLADLHAAQPACANHRQETYEQRFNEAVRTLHSAYSRPGRPRTASEQYSRQLPNSVREALLQMKQTSTLRVLDGLRLAGILPGHSFTTAQALELLRGQVGQGSVYHALKATTADGQPIFEAQTPLPRTHTPADADTKTLPQPTNKCLVGGEQKPRKRSFHRPARVFTMPANLDLCVKLDVKPSLSDPLAADDLRSAKRTRMALQRELIKRRPGIYPRRWLARRLGVGVGTLHAYHREIPIHSLPTYLEFPVTWATLKQIPADFEMEGTFLEDEGGKRYPPRQEIAIKLLAERKRIIYKRQDANYYFYGDTPPDLPVKMGLHPRWNELETRQTQMRQYLQTHLPRQDDSPKPSLPVRLPTKGAASDVPVQSSPTLPLDSEGTEPRAANLPAFTLPSRPKRYYRRPLPGVRLEQLAQEIHKHTNLNGVGNLSGMSLCNARRLVELYGASPVEKALHMMVRLQKRGMIKTPSGFLVVASRVAWRLAHGAIELGSSAPRFRGQQRDKRGRSRHRKR